MKVDRKIAVIGLILAALAIIISTILSLAALSQSKSLAVESGSLKKANIHAVISHVDLIPNNLHRIVFGAKQGELDKGVVIAPFTIGIKNDGDKELENLYITYRYHEMLKRDGLELMEFNVAGPLVDNDISRKFSSSGSSDFVTYHIPKLNPSVGVGIDEPFVLYETKFSDSVEMESFTIPFTVKYSIKFQMSISASSSPHQDYDFNVSVLTANSLNELQNKFIDEVIQTEVEELRSGLSTIEYLGVLLFDNNERDAVLIYPHNQKVEHNEAVIFYPNEGKVEYRTLWYKAAKWSELFQ
ncbi:hypothetical protein [Pseudoalteromonas xiamenensis]